ncbi:MAG: hypothetical protein FRX49_02505 [Trebouxia sp. A1-2]|nr:MAG: hypothetical protein FRX49_02505 [Trebouxia sp. A1-2]
MAKSGLTGLFRARDSRAVMMAQPAEGPSLGVEPAGTCTWMAFVWKKSLPGCLRSRKARLKAVTPHGGPSQAHDHTRGRSLVYAVTGEGRGPHIIFQIIWAYDYLGVFTRGGCEGASPSPNPTPPCSETESPGWAGSAWSFLGVGPDRPPLTSFSATLRRGPDVTAFLNPPVQGVAAGEYARKDRQKAREVTLDFSHVTETTDTETVILPLQGSSNAAPHTGLAHPGGTHQAQDLAMGATPQPPHCNELQNPVLHIFQTIISLLSAGEGSCHIRQPAQVLEVTAKLEGALQLLPVDGVLGKQILQRGDKFHVCGFDYVIVGVVGQIFEVLHCYLERPLLDLQ